MATITTIAAVKLSTGMSLRIDGLLSVLGSRLIGLIMRTKSALMTTTTTTIIDNEWRTFRGIYLFHARSRWRLLFCEKRRRHLRRRVKTLVDLCWRRFSIVLLVCPIAWWLLPARRRTNPTKSSRQISRSSNTSPSFSPSLSPLSCYNWSFRRPQKQMVYLASLSRKLVSSSKPFHTSVVD